MVSGSPCACIRITGSRVSAATRRLMAIVLQGRDVVDDVDAGERRAAHHLRLARVDGDACPHAADEALDHGHDAAQLIGRRDGIGAGTRGFAADVENVGALLLEPQP